MSDFLKVESALGYTFKNKKLLEKALTLSSYDCVNNNESLECLGDAILSFIVCEKYYLEGLNEREITQKKQEYLSDEALRPVSEKLGLSEAFLKDKGDVCNKKAVPSAYEAVCAAMYLDGGMDAVKGFALSTLAPAEKNCVGELKELLEKTGKDMPKISKKDLGTPQEHLWEVRFVIDGKAFSGRGQNIDTAKKIAAKDALEYLKNNGKD